MSDQSQNPAQTDKNSKYRYPEVQSQLNDPSSDHHQQSQHPQSQFNMRQSLTLKDNPQEQPSCCSQILTCSKLDNLKEYFKVTNDDVKNRIISNLMFWRGGFFQPEGQDYDFYGPFWILTTVVFCLSAIPNILAYQAEAPFKFDFSIVGTAFGFVYAEGFLFPVIFTFVLKFLGATFAHIQIICLYGYSMSAMIICLLLCSLNSCLFHILLLIVGCIWKGGFIFKNLMEKVETAKKIMVILIVIGEALLIFLVFRFGFVECQTDSIILTDKSSIQQQIKRLQGQLSQQQHLHQILRSFTFPQQNPL